MRKLRQRSLEFKRPQGTLFGRERELSWLSERFSREERIVGVVGPGGIGKTELVWHFLASIEALGPVLHWTMTTGRAERMRDLRARIDLVEQEGLRPIAIAIEDVDALDSGNLAELADRLLSFGSIRMVLFVGRAMAAFRAVDMLRMSPLEPASAGQMVREILQSDPTSGLLESIVDAAHGIPRALDFLRHQAAAHDADDAARIVQGDIYRLAGGILVPEQAIISDIKPRIALVNDKIVEKIRREPEAIYELPPRKFEELVAELMKDLGYDVELTPASKDGGKDILAYMETPHGRLLCLVEAKRYRRNRPVGVELVKQLHGTLVDERASSAMLVTTSSFTKGARDFEQRHQYRLALKDYTSIVEWIAKYGRR